MWLVFLSLFFFVGIFYSKIELNVKYIFISPKDIHMEIPVWFKWWGILPIFKLYLNQTGIRIGNYKISYGKLISKRKMTVFNRNLLENWKHIKFDKLVFTLKIGLEDIFLTNISVVAIATILPFLICDKVKRKNVKYEILPEYDKVQLQLLGEIKILLSISQLLKYDWQNIKSKMAHNKNKNDEVKESF